MAIKPLTELQKLLIQEWKVLGLYGHANTAGYRWIQGLPVALHDDQMGIVTLKPVRGQLVFPRVNVEHGPPFCSLNHRPKNQRVLDRLRDEAEQFTWWWLRIQQANKEAQQEYTGPHRS